MPVMRTIAGPWGQVSVVVAAFEFGGLHNGPDLFEAFDRSWLT